MADIDCRQCAAYRSKHWPGECISTVRCVDGRVYQATVPVQLWDESRPAIPTGDATESSFGEWQEASDGAPNGPVEPDPTAQGNT